VELLTDDGSPAAAAAEASRVVNRMRERQVLLSATGPQGNILKIRPPLVFSHADADLLLQTLDEVLAGR
jgi:4-aminobutyrate aminotransferase-like enzyme